MADLSNANIEEIYNEYSSLSLKDGDILVFYDPVTKTTRGILAEDVLPNTSNLSSFEWVSTATYSTNDPVIYNGQWWISDVDNNTGNIPTDGPYWTPENKVTAITAKPWAAGIYDQHYSMVEYNLSLYRLKGSATLPFNSATNPSLDATNWELILGASTDATKDHFHVESDLDNVIGPFGYTGNIDVERLELYNGITSVTFEVALDSASPSFVAQADITALNTWIDTNVTGDDDTGTKWLITFITNASKKTGFDFVYTRP